MALAKSYKERDEALKAAQCQECVEQLSEGKEYSEGCKP